MRISKFLWSFIYYYFAVTTHKLWVLYYLTKIIIKIRPENKCKLFKRALFHDLSKYQWQEAKYFIPYILKLKYTTFGSEEYKSMLEKAKPSSDRHYKINRHHPEYYKNGIYDMKNEDILELIADWGSAVKRHKNGNIFKSLEICQKRFNYGNIMKNYIENIIKQII